MSDSGFAASLLGVNQWPGGIDASLTGALLETWVHAQLAVLMDLAEVQTDLHFYRTHSQTEVDFVFVRPRAMIAVEVKHSATVQPKDASGIEALREQFPKEFRFAKVESGRS